MYSVTFRHGHGKQRGRFYDSHRHGADELENRGFPQADRIVLLTLMHKVATVGLPSCRYNVS